ncbi:hypothetical protein GOV07_04140 [Candidatus Woesearchaeota archaeon]|nr:hypothetical protein [Candidatus Woesearchaeota archaeon]
MTSPSFSAGSQSPPQTMRARQPSPAERLRQLDELKHEVHADFARLDKSLADETILLSDYRDHIHKFYRGLNEREVIDRVHKEERKIRRGIEHAQREPHHVPMAAVVLVLVAIGMFSVFLFNPGGFTGYSTLPIEPVDLSVDELFTESTTYELNFTNISSLRASGILTDGTGELWLLSGEERLLLWQGEATDVYSVTTDKESYALGGEISVTVTPADSSYTLWLTDAAGDKTVVQETFDIVIPGDYVLDALINDSGNITKTSTSFIIRNDTNTSNDILRALTLATTEFSNACVDTCELIVSGPLSLEVVLSEGATLDLVEVVTDMPRENSAPLQLQTIPNFEVDEGGIVSTDLNQYFEDSDGDAITYDFMNAVGVDISIDGSVMTLTGVSAGVTQSLIYASDLYELMQSDPFTITVNAVEETNITPVNDSNQINNSNTTPPDTNTTNITIVSPIEPFNTTLNCTNPDPNLRPLGCLELESAKYFQDQTIYISDGKRRPLARLTPIGNLLLTGTVHPNAAFNADIDDYVIGYEDDFGRFVVTVWFSGDGDLYLKGNLYEENANAVPPPGSYALRNRKGVTLAWAMQHSGDLYVRGNVIPYRLTITE